MRFEAPSAAPQADLWRLISRPARWHEWAPHIRGANGLGWPEVRAGATGTVSLLGLIGVPARVTSVDPGRGWSWRVGPFDIDHVAASGETGSRAVIVLRGRGAVGKLLASAYAPAVWALNRNLARVAAAQAG
ncbi:SRPBCC family protein [Thermoleophilia bacterium SCSIO 60948]|nr:SRPBCC family protein [Thermoleophilia bacterium SCSIO 60948]